MYIVVTQQVEKYWDAVSVEGGEEVCVNVLVAECSNEATGAKRGFHATPLNVITSLDQTLLMYPVNVPDINNAAYWTVSLAKHSRRLDIFTLGHENNSAPCLGSKRDTFHHAQATVVSQSRPKGCLLYTSRCV